MKKWLKRRFALSDEGATAVLTGSIETALLNIACMLPVGLLFLLVKDLLDQKTGEYTMLYMAGSVICLAAILVIGYFQYNGTYLATYVETGKRRIALAEKLRKIPLSYFGKKDLADLKNGSEAEKAELQKQINSLKEQPKKLRFSLI
mgnify:FL=1